MSFWALLAIGVITAFVAVLLTDLTSGWSWLIAPLAALAIVVIGDRRRAVHSRTIVLDAVKLGAILMITLPIALAAIVFAVWAL